MIYLLYVFTKPRSFYTQESKIILVLRNVPFLCKYQRIPCGSVLNATAAVYSYIAYGLRPALGIHIAQFKKSFKPINNKVDLKIRECTYNTVGKTPSYL